jgi:hypothetical protein
MECIPIVGILDLLSLNFRTVGTAKKLPTVGHDTPTLPLDECSKAEGTLPI